MAAQVIKKKAYPEESIQEGYRFMDGCENERAFLQVALTQRHVMCYFAAPIHRTNRFRRKF